MKRLYRQLSFAIVRYMDMFLLESKISHKTLIILGFLLTALYGYGHFIDGDVLQMLARAHLLVTQNVFTHYGNVSSSGSSGNTPGSFLTFITGVPMLLWFTPWSALIVLAFLHYFAFLMFKDVVKNFLNSQAILLLIVLFWLNPWRLSEVFIWNPAYIYFVSLLHMWSAFHLSKRASFRFSMIHGLSLFLGLQVHPSFIILFFMTMILLWMKALKPHIMGTFSGILLGLLSLLPYFLEGLKNPQIFPHTGSGDGQGYLFFGLINVYPMLKGFWYWILFGSNIFQTHIFHQVQFDWIENKNFSILTRYIWTFVKYLMGTVGVILSFYVNYHFIKKNKEKFKILTYKMKSPSEWLSLYTIVALISGLIATALSPTNPIYWHLLYFWPMSIVPLLIFLSNALNDPQKVRRASQYLVLLVVYFSMTNLLAALGSKKHDIRQSFHELYFETCNESCLLKEPNSK